MSNSVTFVVLSLAGGLVLFLVSVVAGLVHQLLAINRSLTPPQALSDSDPVHLIQFVVQAISSAQESNLKALSEAIKLSVPPVSAGVFEPSYDVPTTQPLQPFYADEARPLDNSDPTDMWLPGEDREDFAFLDGDEDEPFGVPGLHIDPELAAMQNGDNWPAPVPGSPAPAGPLSGDR